MRRSLHPAGVLAFAAFLAAGCQQFGLQPAPEKPKPVAPQITEQTLRERAREQLATGVRQYNAGEYENAQRNLQASLDHGLLDKQEQSTARKHLAFIHCVSQREAACRDEFRKAFEIDGNFALAPNEDGHPIWGPVYRSVRVQLIAEREAASNRPLIVIGKAEQLIADAVAKYEAGDIADAQRLFEAAIKEGPRDKADRVKAMKHVAFCLCLQGRFPQCRAQFLSIYPVEPTFDLTPAEAGHPSWVKTYAAAKAQWQKSEQERIAKENAAAKKAAAAKDAKAAPPAASAAPKKAGTP